MTDELLALATRLAQRMDTLGRERARVADRKMPAGGDEGFVLFSGLSAQSYGRMYDIASADLGQQLAAVRAEFDAL